MWGGGSSKQWEGGHWLEFLDGASWDGLVERVILSKDLETYDFLGEEHSGQKEEKEESPRDKSLLVFTETYGGLTEGNSRQWVQMADEGVPLGHHEALTSP